MKEALSPTASGSGFRGLGIRKVLGFGFVLSAYQDLLSKAYRAQYPQMGPGSAPSVWV